jgi:hypothetical protein
MLATLIIAFSSGVTSAFVVHVLTRSREREAWVRNCEKEEWRELFKVMTKAEVSLLRLGRAMKENRADADYVMDYDVAWREAMTVMLDRIFIVGALGRTGAIARWMEIKRQFDETHDIIKTADEFSSIKATLIEAATRRSSKSSFTIT